MDQKQLTAMFDQHASSYDQKWVRLAPINQALHLLTSALLAPLPSEAKILCVGAGTGAEIFALAAQFPGWHFTAVEPSQGMLEVCRSRAESLGLASRCCFHLGYLETLPAQGSYDAATAFLVSQFILEPQSRSQFFRGIAERLAPEGILVSSDLAGDLHSPECQHLLGVWCEVMRGNRVPLEEIEKMREGYGRDVAILPPEQVRELLLEGGFAAPVHFFQAGMIHAWYAQSSLGAK